MNRKVKKGKNMEKQMRLIKEFSDNCQLLLEILPDGEHRIWYKEPSHSAYKIGLREFLKMIGTFFDDNKGNINKCQMLKILREELGVVNVFDSYSMELLDKITTHYGFDSLMSWTKMSYTILSMYYAEDHKPNTVLLRSMFIDAASRIINGENIDYVSGDYHGKKPNVILEMIRKTEDKYGKECDKRQIAGDTCGWG